MARDTFTTGTETPAGKRTTRRNARGNLIGYIGRTSWETINVCGIEAYSEAETIAAAAWVAGDPDWINAPWRD